MDDLMPSPCYTPREFLALGQELPNFSSAMSRADTVRIVAVGSSSTEGHGASSRDASYPARLAVGLAARFPDRKFDVVNAGVGGQEAPDEAARFKNDVLSNKPSLVVWQLGTNAAWKDYFLDDVQAAVFRGCDHLRGCKTDLILMDLQYAPALLDEKERPKLNTGRMLELIAAAAAKENLGLFRRYEIMKYWHTVGGIAFEQMISNSDGNWLHQNDWSYNCIAEALCEAIVEGAGLG